MTEHIRVNDNFVAALVESAAWGAARLNVAEKEVQAVSEEATELVEEHTCPLCESVLDEDLSEERLLEHLQLVSEILESLLVEEEEELQEEEDEEDVEEERGDKKGDKGAGKDKDDDPDYTTDSRKGDDSKTHPGKKDFMKKMKGKTAKAC